LSSPSSPPPPNSLPTYAATTVHNIIIPSKITLNYTEIAQQLSKIPIQNEVYSNWVQFYSSNESCKQVDEIKQILNVLSQNENEKSKDIMKNHFINACKYEFVFWEMAYNLHG
jgi:thiaminase (transcriptional activator TenA)